MSQTENNPAFTPKSVSVTQWKSPGHSQPNNFPAEKPGRQTLASALCIPIAILLTVLEWEPKCASPKAFTGGSFIQLVWVPVITMWQPRDGCPNRQNTQDPWEHTSKLLSLHGCCCPDQLAKPYPQQGWGGNLHLGVPSLVGLSAQLQINSLTALIPGNNKTFSLLFSVWEDPTESARSIRGFPCLLTWTGGCTGGAEEKVNEQDLDLSS